MGYDVLIENGHIIDGKGNPWFRDDVGFVGDSIEVIGRLEGAVNRVTRKFDSVWQGDLRAYGQIRGGHGEVDTTQEGWSDTRPGPERDHRGLQEACFPPCKGKEAHVPKAETGRNL